jgi:hypothetical protein
MAKKKMTEAKYSKMMNDIGSDLVLEYEDMLDDSQLYYDSASCMLDNDDEGLLEYITETLGVDKQYAKERLADDIYGGVLRAKK